MTETLDSREVVGCLEWERLYGLFVSALSDVIAIELEQARAYAKDGAEAVRIDRLLRSARIRQVGAKRALIRHLEAHRRCGSEDPVFPGGSRLSDPIVSR